MDYDSFVVQIESGGVVSIKVENKAVSLKSLLGTPLWDKVNNIITLSGRLKSSSEYYTERIWEGNYKSFLDSCKYNR